MERAVFEHFIVVHIPPIAGVPHVPLVVAVVVVIGPHHIKLLPLLQVNLLLSNSAHFLGPRMNIIEYLKMFIKLFSVHSDFAHDGFDKLFDHPIFHLRNKYVGNVGSSAKKVRHNLRESHQTK